MPELVFVILAKRGRLVNVMCFLVGRGGRVACPAEGLGSGVLVRPGCVLSSDLRRRLRQELEFVLLGFGLGRAFWGGRSSALRFVVHVFLPPGCARPLRARLRRALLSCIAWGRLIGLRVVSGVGGVASPCRSRYILVLLFLVMARGALV